MVDRSNPTLCLLMSGPSTVVDAQIKKLLKANETHCRGYIGAALDDENSFKVFMSQRLYKRLHPRVAASRRSHSSSLSVSRATRNKKDQKVD